METPVAENRRHKRMSYYLSVWYKPLKDPGVIDTGSLTENISEGGVCFKSKAFMQLSSRVVLKISLPAIPKPVEVISRVAWVRKISSAEQYEIGSQFLEMTEEDSAKIRNFIYQR